MTRDDLLTLHSRLSQEAAALMARKNADYGGDEDALKNLRLHGCFGISVRLHDKVCRLESASKRELQVADETAKDTCLDLINYAVLYLAIKEEG